jgi:uncharacterized lipoprotein YajG
MKNTLFAVLAATALFATAASAEEAATPAPAPIEQTAAAPAEAVSSAPLRVRSGVSIYAADDARIGRVANVTERSAFVTISGGRLVAVPLSSLSRQDGKIVTTLTLEEVTG